MKMKGWIKIHRQVSNWGWFRDPNVFCLWIHLLLLANWKDKPWRGIIIKRGSLVTSINSLSQETGLTPRQIRTAVDKLLITEEIDRQTTNKYTIITVNNYNKYQVLDKQMTNKRQTNDKQMTTTKEYKNIRTKELNNKIESVYTPPNLNENDFKDISIKYNVPIDFVRLQYDKVVTWAESKPNNPKLRGRNWKMTLMTFVREASLKIKQDYVKQNRYRGIDASNVK